MKWAAPPHWPRRPWPPAVEQAAARLADLERKAAFFDAAVVGDPLALGRTMAAPSGDPVREGISPAA